MQILQVNNININCNVQGIKHQNASKQVSFEGIVRPSKFFKTKGSLTRKAKVFLYDVKRNYNNYDFKNSGKIKNSDFIKLPVIKQVFDFCEMKLKNVKKVSDKYFRGGIVACEYDILRLKKKGVTDIISLTEDAKFSRKLADFARENGVNYHRVEMKPPYGIPTIEQVKDFLNIVDNSKGAVYVHCLHGKDRTGVMTFFYETERLGKPAEKALKNMLNLGFHARKNKHMVKFLTNFYPPAEECVKKFIK